MQPLLDDMTDNNQEELLVNWPQRGADSDGCLFCGVAAEKALRRNTLLVHWPKRNSSMTVSSFDLDEEADDDAAAAAAPSANSRGVDFSESSQLIQYERESMSLLRSLAYTKEDRKRFGKDTHTP